MWLTCAPMFIFRSVNLPYPGKLCLLPQERHLRKRSLYFLQQGDFFPKKYVKVTGLAVKMQFVPAWMGQIPIT